MKAVVWHGVGDIRVDDVPEPKIHEPYDAIVRITSSAICGTDLHFVRGTMPGMKEGRILGHEAVGIVEEVGAGVRNFRPGDRVVVPSTVACGTCSYCRAGYYAQCDNANPGGKRAGTVFFGGPEAMRRPGRTAGGVRPDPVRPRRAGAAAGHRRRRPGDPAVRHLPHGVVRRAAGRDRLRRHGRDPRS
ncbi:alcohol dehydrogenase catalytic domain-containing protein [Streptomyces radiopugnans]|nr:alcohol dehydrogenase catalytic domain-containing protein [Streptomyces radiopugnans]